MELTPWKPEFEGLGALGKQMGRLFEDFFGERSGAPAKGSVWAPVDVVETPETVLVKAEIPGINPKEVEVSIHDNRLTLKGERREEKEEKGKTWHRIERSHGAFTRSVLLPCDVEGERAEAEAKDGVLTITVPKSKAALARRIEVKSK